MSDKIELISKYLEVVLSSSVHSLFIRGPQGLGKTHAILDKLNSMGYKQDEHYLYKSGHITPLKLYEILREAMSLDKPHIVFIDDVDSLLKDRTSVAILKSALAEAGGKRIVSFESKGVPTKSFEFTGKIVLVVNSFVKNKLIEPLLDRGIFYDIELEPEEKKKYIDERLEKIAPEVSMDDKKTVWEKAQRFVDNPNFSIRSLVRAFVFYKHDKANWYNMWRRTLIQNI